MSGAGRIMMTHMKIVAAVALLMGVCALAQGGEFATKDEAVAMVKTAVAFVKQEGGEKAYTAFPAKDAFADHDLYVVVHSNDGEVLAHGSNPKLVGKDMNDARDVDGKYYVKECLALAAKQESFWPG